MNESEILLLPPLQPVISHAVLWWLRMTFMGVLCQGVALFGIISNIINMIVFIKLDIKDPINISLVGLSFSDFAGCLSIAWNNLCLFPPFMELDLPFEQLGAHYLYGGGLHSLCIKITTLITTFITVERCLCVTFPLKVKELITTKRVTAIILLFYLLNMSLAAPIYHVYYYDWVFSEERNRTVYTLLARDSRAVVEPIMILIIGVIIPIGAFLVTIVSTAILVYQLKKNARWRQEATGASGTTKAQADSSSQSQSSSSRNQVSSRDTRVAKMVVMISVLFLISFSPVMMSTVAMMVVPGMNEGGSRQNLLHFVFYLNFLLETTNSSLNIFIYYYMSSNYKTMFRKMFRLQEHETK